MLGWRHGHTSLWGGLFLWDCSVPSEETFLISCLGKKIQVFWGEGGDSSGVRVGRVRYFNKFLSFRFILCLLSTLPSILKSRMLLFNFCRGETYILPPELNCVYLSAGILCVGVRREIDSSYTETFILFFHFVLSLHLLDTSKVWAFPRFFEGKFSLFSSLSPWGYSFFYPDQSDTTPLHLLLCFQKFIEILSPLLPSLLFAFSLWI